MAGRRGEVGRGRCDMGMGMGTEKEGMGTEKRGMGTEERGGCQRGQSTRESTLGRTSR